MLWGNGREWDAGGNEGRARVGGHSQLPHIPPPYPQPHPHLFPRVMYIEVCETPHSQFDRNTVPIRIGGVLRESPRVVGMKPTRGHSLHFRSLNPQHTRHIYSSKIFEKVKKGEVHYLLFGGLHPFSRMPMHAGPRNDTKTNKK